MTTHVYEENETYWIMKNGLPYSRASSRDLADAKATEVFSADPKAEVKIKREVRITEEIRTFSPLKDY